MVISQFDYQMYQDEIRKLEDEMRQLLIDMELYHQSRSTTEFTRWWTEEGREKRYFACKGRIEQIRNFLAVAQVEEADHPKMRGGSGTAGPLNRRYS